MLLGLELKYVQPTIKGACNDEMPSSVLREWKGF